MEFEELKAAVLAAEDAQAEARAMRELGLWFRRRPYGYMLHAKSQEGGNGVAPESMRAGEEVEVLLHKKSDLFSPVMAQFTFVPKDPRNLILLEGRRASAGEGRP